MLLKWLPYTLKRGDVVLGEIEYLEEGREYSGTSWSATAFEYRPDGKVSARCCEFCCFSDAQSWIRLEIARQSQDQRERASKQQSQQGGVAL